METTEQPRIAEILMECSFRFEEDTNTIKIRQGRYGSVFRFVFFNLTGLILLIIGLFQAFNLYLILPALAIASLTRWLDKKSWPYSIIIDKVNQTLTLKHGISYQRALRFSEITSLLVDESVLDSDTSPFKDGYQDFDYAFYLVPSRGKTKLIRFTFRKENSDKMQQIFNFLRQALKL